VGGAGSGGAGSGGAGAGPGRPAAKSWPHDSQNRPLRAAPHWGQDWSGSAAGPVTGLASVAGARLGGAPISMPHTSQKSSLADA
jgi:hypothetical protein